MRKPGTKGTTIAENFKQASKLQRKRKKRSIIFLSKIVLFCKAFKTPTIYIRYDDPSHIIHSQKNIHIKLTV